MLLYKGYPGDPKEIGQPDALLVATPTIKKQYSSLSVPVHVLYHAFNPHVLELLAEKSGASHDFTFIGSSGFGKGLTHYSRYELLYTLLKKTPIELWIDGQSVGSAAIAKENIIQLFMKGWARLSPSQRKKVLAYKGLPKSLRYLLEEIDYHEQHLPPRGKAIWPLLPLPMINPARCHEAVFGLAMYRVLAASHVTLNRHTDGALTSVGNLRLFEATGVGACLLTDTGDNMADLFIEGKEIVTYESSEDCAAKVDYLFHHESERQAIAKAGQARTLRDHTVARRCESVDSLIQQLL